MSNTTTIQLPISPQAVNAILWGLVVILVLAIAHQAIQWGRYCYRICIRSLLQEEQLRQQHQQQQPQPQQYNGE